MADKKKFNYGGQAVIEGVMIRGRSSVVTAVRKPSGDISYNVKPMPSTFRSRVRRIPFVRGVVILIEAMVIGIQSLLHSANVSLEEEEEKIPTKAIWGMMLVSVALVVILFFVAPLFLTNWISSNISNSLVFMIIEGVIRIAIFVAYIKVISYLPDIKRVFTYHGAEHKAVNAYEAGVPMEVNAIKEYSRLHVRCGTSFLFFVLIVAIVIFTFVGKQDMWLMVVSRIVLIPVILGLGYELIYFGAKHVKNRIMRAVLAPGLWLQRMTTAEPDDKQLEVAIAAVNRAVEIDLAEEAETTAAIAADTPSGS